MEEVWFFFKSIEASIGIVCMSLHVHGFLDDRQPLPHQMLFCGTFFGFTMIAILGNVAISMGCKSPILLEAIISAIATIFYINSSIFSMYHAERDFHLMYLSDHEESMHPFFVISKQQGIASLSCGLLYMLHTVFALDAAFITDDRSDHVGAKADADCYRPIKLYILGKPIHDFLMQQSWFLTMVGKRTSEEETLKVVRDRLYVRRVNI